MKCTQTTDGATDRVGPAMAPVMRPGLGGSSTGRRNVYLETYGCQMNVNDSEVVLSVLADSGYTLTEDVSAADVILLNTCAIREKAEQRVWQRLAYFRSLRRPGAQRSPRAEGGSTAAANANAAAAARFTGAVGAPPPVGEGVVIGVLGCMAERLKSQLLEADRLADIVAGPDAYRDLPRLIDAVSGTGEKAMNVQLSAEETYGDIVPVRPDGTKSAFVTIMRGCDNACAFCIVPYTRGRERSRDPASIEYEVRLLSEAGVKEVTLLGQNVNSYAFSAEDADAAAAAAAAAAAPAGEAPAMPTGAAALESTADFTSLLLRASGSGGASSAPSSAPPSSADAGLYAPGFSTRYAPERRRAGAMRFAELLDRVAGIDPEMRIRFTSPHPKDFPDEVLRVIAARPNVCACLHMPAQSGSDSMLSRMARGYTRDAYLALVARARDLIPGVEFTSDFISGFCGETEEEHADTVALVRAVGYTQAFMFAYSERAGTAAARHQADDVPEEVKQRRLAEVIEAFREVATARNQAEVGRVHCVLVEGPSKKSDAELAGRTDNGKTAVFADVPIPAVYTPAGAPAGAGGATVRAGAGDYVAVLVERASTGTLMGTALGRTTLSDFQRLHGRQFTLAPRGAVATAR
jgi:tRNA A37 methylthiotransferase MiaB